MKPKRNARNVMDGLDLLRTVSTRTASLVVFDPQYRGVLDAMSYGNEGERQRSRAGLPQMSHDDIAAMIAEASRALRASRHLFLWCDKFMIGQGAHVELVGAARQLKIVDMIAWDKASMGMGARSRSQTEYLVVAQKHPTLAREVWMDRGIRDVHREKALRSAHPHAKPLALMSRLINAVTRPGELVVDPCAGSYGTLDVCRALKREFLGCDLL